MAESARAMRAADLGQRLPNTGTHDELEELSLAFNGLLDRLQESFQRQERFTGDASHQLRTPLTAMLGQIEVALRRDRPPEEYQRVLKLIDGQASRLREILEMLFFLAHADAEARFPHLENLNLSDWLSEYFESWSGHPRAADLRVDNRASHLLTVKVHPSLLGQLIDNLMENACKHSQPGTAITVRLWNEPNLACLSVEDAGCGILPEDLTHIFEPFYRSSHARGLGIGGVGLGLSVAQRIAVVFGGCISVTSELAKGSSFLLQLPLVGTPAPSTTVSEKYPLEAQPLN
jgi:signal transduction histidine kinase